MPSQTKLTHVPRVINDILDVVGRPQGSYAECFVSIYLLLAERLNKENRRIVIMLTPPNLTQVPRVIHDNLDVLSGNQG